MNFMQLAQSIFFMITSSSCPPSAKKSLLSKASKLSELKRSARWGRGWQVDCRQCQLEALVYIATGTGASGWGHTEQCPDQGHCLTVQREFIHALVQHWGVLAKRGCVMVTHAHMSAASLQHGVPLLPWSLCVMATGQKEDGSQNHHSCR